MKIVVTYTSKTGFTEQYAKWMASELHCDAIPLKQLSSSEEIDLLIHGGWIMAGMISGLKEACKIPAKQMICFGVGFTQIENYVETLKQQNQIQIPTFYFKGGTNPKKMNFIMRKMVQMVTKQKVIYTDLTNKDSIQPLIELVHHMEE